LKSILFVCLGNICRSPIAEGVACEFVVKNNLDIVVDSCGTGDYHKGETPCPNSIKVAFEHGIDISSHRARAITKEDFKKFDFIVALDESNISNLLKMGAPKEKLYKLGSFGYDNQDVPDPYFFDGFKGFEKVFLMIESCVHTLIEEIQK
jgi:protein-tyrosine phosphatase